MLIKIKINKNTPSHEWVFQKSVKIEECNLSFLKKHEYNFQIKREQSYDYFLIIIMHNK